jgi:chromosome segregation ATPase
MPDPSKMAFLNFQSRWEQLEAHKDLSNALIRDMLAYYNEVEASLKDENDRLSAQLKDTQLDLEDALKSRRDLQRELGQAKQTIDRFNVDYHLFMVGECWLRGQPGS